MKQIGEIQGQFLVLPKFENSRVQLMHSVAMRKLDAIDDNRSEYQVRPSGDIINLPLNNVLMSVGYQISRCMEFASR